MRKLSELDSRVDISSSHSLPRPVIIATDQEMVFPSYYPLSTSPAEHHKNISDKSIDIAPSYLGCYHYKSVYVD